MNDIERYDPEDLEQLMRERRFEELLEEEKAYVLRHMSGPEEYEQVRKTLLAVAAHMDADMDIEPDPKIKEALMSQFVKEEQAGFTYYLNSIKAFFLPTGRNFYAQPAYQFAMAAVAVLVGIFFLYQPAVTENVAELEKTEEPQDRSEDLREKEKIPAQIADSSEPDFRKKALVVENEAAIGSDADFAETIQLEDEAEIDMADEMVHDLPERESLPEERQIAATEEESVDMIAKGSTQRKAEYAAYDHQGAEDAKNDENVVSNKGTTAGAVAPTTIQMDTTADDYLSYSDDVRVGNSVEPQVTNQMVFENENLDAVEISAEKGRSSKKYKDNAARPALKSANMRQYSELIGLLHTTL